MKVYVYRNTRTAQRLHL